MGIKLNPLTGLFDIAGGGGGAGAIYWLDPVANEAALGAGDPDGTGRVVLDQNALYIYDSGSTNWYRQVPSIGSVSGTSTANAISITESTTGGITSFQLALHPADATNPGILTTGTQSIAGDKTFSNNIIITGDLTVNGTTTTINTTNLDVTDANITVNNGGNDVSAEGAGITVERAGTDGSLVYEDALASKFKAGSVGSEIELANVSSTQTLTNKTIDADNNTISNLAHGAEVDNPTSGVHGVTGNVVGTSDTQTLTNKTIDADNNTISNLAHGAEVDNPTSGVHGVTGNVVGTSDTQTLTNKTIDADSNTISNIDNNEIKAAAGIEVSKLETLTASRALQTSGSGVIEVSLVTATELGYLDGVTSAIQTQLDGKVDEVASTDNALVKFDGVTGSVQNTGVTLSDTNDMTFPATSSITVPRGAAGNEAYGSGALANATGNGNTAVGNNALNVLTVGTSNVAVGSGAGQNTTSSSNTFVGVNAGSSNTGGSIVAIGQSAGASGTEGSNVFIGVNAALNMDTGFENIIIGTSAARNLDTDNDRNVLIGASVADNSTGISDSVIIGHRSSQNVEGSGNVFIGHQVLRRLDLDPTPTTLNNTLAIHNGDTDLSTSFPLIYGQFDSRILQIHGTLEVRDQNVLRFYEDSTNGTNYVALKSPADLSSNTTVYTLPTSDGNADQVLKTDGSANLDWQTVELPSTGDLNETSFSLTNSQTNASIVGLAFANASVRSAQVQYSIVIDEDSDLYEEGTLKLIQRGADWLLARETTGDDSLVDIDVTSSGQVIYTTPAYSNFVSGTMKFRADVTGV